MENQPHYLKDVAMDADRSLVHLGHGPTILARLRDSALSLTRLSGCRTIANRLRALADNPTAAVAPVTQSTLACA